jgi:signal transduction histidine kinase
LTQLQQGVQLIAAGNFATTLSDAATDEVGRLCESVNTMAVELQQLWQQVNRQQSQKLLHQIAGGMAHQLRNTLTGARLALELHRQSCSHADQQDVEVALREMESAEDYVRRLLLVGTGEQQSDQPSNVLACLHSVRASHAAVAKHLRVDLEWELEEALAGFTVADGATLASAVSNLVLNGLQAASRVQVRAELVDECICRVEVLDNGPGVDASIAEQLFEPFVTTKPEGVGLGLPLVRRAADKLSGQVEWNRQAAHTRFEFRCKVTPCQI